MDATLPRLMTPHELAHCLSWPTARVIRMARDGGIPCVVLPNGDLLFDEGDIGTWLASKKRALPFLGVALGEMGLDSRHQLAQALDGRADLLTGPIDI